MKAEPRVAFFTDSYLEVNGVANTSRRLTAYAAGRGLPLLCVHAGPETASNTEGSLELLALKRSGIGLRLDADLRFDLLMMRHLRKALRAVGKFRADLVHITGPSDTGLLGALVAWRLGLPLVMSWHTNIHEYAGRRLGQAISDIPGLPATGASRLVEQMSLGIALWFYRHGRVLMAPNEELASLLETRCQRPVAIMSRGVDASLFNPTRRRRRGGPFTLGYVGRLTPEKNVRSLATIEKYLIEDGLTDFRFVIVGTGSERKWLEENMRRAEFTGTLQGEALAGAYADFDLFIFPSWADTFGNVVLEAQASGVPAIVMLQGGPRFIIRNGITGFIAEDERAMAGDIRRLMSQPETLEQMRRDARKLALEASWEAVFDRVWLAYQSCLQMTEGGPRLARAMVNTGAIR